VPLSFRCLVLIAALAAPALAQDRAADLHTAVTRAAHLRHGINASIWFAQHPQDYSAQYTNHETTPEDIATMARLGFDNVRLSVDAAPLEQYPRGGDGLNDEFVARLDGAVDAILADGMAVTIDLHPEGAFKQTLRSGSDGVERAEMLWRRLAEHYANRDPERVFFEIMNEPEVGDPARWAGIQTRLAAAIRAAAPRQTIIATGPNYSGLADLLTQQPLPDGNVIYTFHFYEPHTFTHQGATWGVPWWVYEHGVPYPATDGAMQELLAQVPDAADRYQFEQYWLDHWDAHRIRLEIDAVAAWGRANRVPLICNEFGVYRAVTPVASRLAWLSDVRTALEADSIGWAMWDYHNGFGVAVKGKDGKSVVDPETVKALGLAQ